MTAFVRQWREDGWQTKVRGYVPLRFEPSEAYQFDWSKERLFIGGTGTGKTHLATALGVVGIAQHGKKVRFFSTIDLANALEQEKKAGKSGRLAMSLVHMDMVILDELGYLPFS